MWRYVGLVVVCGCNAIFGLEPTHRDDSGIIIKNDLDLDGIPDDVDPCLASMKDRTLDYDQDGLANLDDPCPLDDTTSDPSDPDGDLLPSTCDPFPAASGDTLRCLMTFRNTDLNSALWRERDDLDEWSSVEGALTTKTPSQTSSSITTRELETSVQPTFEADVSLANVTANQQYTFRIYARASDTPSPNDLGCELSGGDTAGRVAVVLGDGRDLGAVQVTGLFPKNSTAIRIRMTYSADTTEDNVRCSVIGYAGATARVARATAALPPGRFAFATENLGVRVTALAIYDRATREPLP